MVFKKGHSYNKGKENGMYGRKAEKNPTWKGGRTIHKHHGYVWIYAPEHPHALHGIYVKEHRLVMEKHLGRHLLPTEVVHHINNSPNDNRIENLMLFQSNAEHRKCHPHSEDAKRKMSNSQKIRWQKRKKK